MKFINREIGMGCQPYIVAEISCNHGGDINEAFTLIEVAKDKGADAAKIQVYTPDEMVIDKGYNIKGGAWDGLNLHELYTKTQTPHAWVPKLFDYARGINFPLFASVFSIKGLELLESLGCPAYKIASFEASDLHLVDRCLQTGKPVVVSVSGIANDYTVTQLSMMRPQPIIMHCTSQYPTPLDGASLFKIGLYRSLFGHVGYSDHNVSLSTASHAVTAGAVIIERHLARHGDTEDKDFSLNPAQFKLYVESIRRAGNMMKFCDHQAEKEGYSQFLRTVYATREIKRGELVTEENTATFRPFNKAGIAAHHYPSILAKKIVAHVHKGQPLAWSHVKK